jgi:hypothetical protein
LTYTPTVWADEVPAVTPIKYVITGSNSDCTIALKDAPTAGTPVNATNLNNIETGIQDALDLAADAYVLHRQGGSATNWDTAGVTNYTPAKSMIQCGTFVSGDIGTTTVAFPVNFSHAPIVFFSSKSNYGVVAVTNTTSVLTSGFIALTLNMISGDPLSVCDVYWWAVGPA